MMADRDNTRVAESATAGGQPTQTQGGHGGAGSDRRTITITVNGSPVVLTERALTGATLKAKAGIPADYELYAVHGASTKAVADTDTVHLHDGSEFRAIPAGTFGSDASVDR